MLLDGQTEVALRRTTELLDDVGNILGPGEGRDAFLGAVIAIHALALAGEAQEEEALWWWFLAQNLKPDLRTLPLEPYGAGGERLSPYRYLPGTQCQCASEPDAGEGRAEDGDGDEGEVLPLTLEVDPPRKAYAPKPDFPSGVRGLRGKVILQMVVDEEGQIHRPCLLRSDAPAFTYAAARAVRTWKMKPARLEGKPVAVYYNLTLHFRE